MLNELKNNLAKYWLLLFFLLTAAIAFIYQVSFQQILETISALKLWQIGVLLFIFFVNSCIHILSRKYLLNSLESSCGIRNLTLIHFSTLAAHYSTPAKIGFPAAVYLLNKFEDIPYHTSSTMILIEIVMSTLLCALIGLLGLPSILDKSLQLVVASIFVVVIMGGLIYLIMDKILENIKFGIYIKCFFSKVSESFKKLQVQHFVVYLLFLSGLRILGGINLLVLCSFFSTNITLWQAIVTTSTAFFIGAISMIPLGLGTRDITLLMYLQHFNVSNSVALVIIGIQRIMSTGLSFILGLVFGSILGVKNIILLENER